MGLFEDEFIQIFAKQCMHCLQKTLLPYKYDFICIAFGYNIITQKIELTDIQRKKINFVKRLKHADRKKFMYLPRFIWKKADRIFDEIFKNLSQLKNKKFKKLKISLKKYKNMSERADFEQTFFSRPARSVY